MNFGGKNIVDNRMRLMTRAKHLCMHRRGVWSVAILLIGLTFFCVPAHATFPGEDGRIAFTMAGDVFTMNADGTGLKQLTSFAINGNTAYLPSWSPDGQLLVFQLTPVDPVTSQLWIMNGDGTNQRQLLNDPSFFDGQPSFSPDGAEIVFTRCAMNCAIYRVGLNGTALQAVTHFDPNPDIVDFFAEYSPDGRTIAFSNVTRGGIIAGVYLIDVDGSNLRLLTPPTIEAWNADWSPDGKGLAFVSQFVQGVLDEDLLIIMSDGSGQKQLTNNNSHWNGYLTGSHASRPSWSPQGDAIVFEQDSPDFSSSAIFVLKDGTTHMLMSAPMQKKLIGRPPSTDHETIKRPVDHRSILIETGGMSPNWGSLAK